MRQEHRADGLIADAGGDEGAHRSVAAIDEIGHAVDDDGAGRFTAVDKDPRPAARPEQDQARAGRRRRAVGLTCRRLREERRGEAECGQFRGASEQAAARRKRSIGQVHVLVSAGAGAKL